MKKAIFIAAIFLLAACSGPSLNPSAREATATEPGLKTPAPTAVVSNTPTVTPTMTVTPTETPTAIPSSTPTPVINLPVMLGTPIPAADEPINSKNAEQVSMLAHYSDKAFLISVSGKKHLIGYISFDRVAKIIDTVSGGISQEIKDQVFVQISPNGKFMAAANQKSEISLWTTTDRALYKAIPQKGIFMAFSPDESLFASCDLNANIAIYALDPFELKAQFNGKHLHCGNQLKFSPDGKWLYTLGGATGKDLYGWDVATQKLQMLISNPCPADAMLTTKSIPVFLPDGKSVLWLYNNNKARACAFDDALPTVLSLQTGAVVSQFAKPPGIPDPNATFYNYAMDMSPDGSLLAIWVWHGYQNSVRHGLQLWNWGTRTLIKEIPITGEIRDLSFSPDGLYLVTAIEGQGIYVWGIAR